MMFSVKSNGNNSSSIISEGVKIEGNVHFPYPVEIDGIVIGDIISDDVLIIGREGKVESNIKVKNAVISGKFTGDMTASGTVTITTTGKFIGNLFQKGTMLAIEKGGLFRGKSVVSNGKSHNK
jgi:cytoskeletal protein CcmA (bactofilin family)